MLEPNFSPFPQLTTQRTILRQLTADDAASVQAMRSDPEVMKYINRPLALTLADALSWIEVVLARGESGEGITWAIALKEDPAEHIGNIGLWRIEKENYRAEIGYMIAPQFQGQGLMFEAIQKVVDYGFAQLKLHSIEGQTDPRNIASGSLLKKVGFVQEAYFKENHFAHGQFSDTTVFSLLTPYANASGKS